MIISAHQRQSDGPTEADEGSQEEDGSDEDNISEEKGNKEDNNKDNDSKQEHTKDNALVASVTSIDCMFVFFSWYFFISYFTLLLGLSGMNSFFFVPVFLKIIFSGPAGI